MSDHEPDVASAGTGPTGLPRCPERDPFGCSTRAQCTGREWHPGAHVDVLGHTWHTDELGERAS